MVKKRSKRVAMKIKKLITRYTVVVFDGNYKQFNFHGSMHHVSIFVNKTSLMQFFRYLF